VDAYVQQQIDYRYCYANKRLILLDYDGTLVPFNKDINAVAPDSELLHLLGSLCSDDNNRVVIISGRDRGTLNEWLGHMPVDIVAEHGAWFKEYGKKWSSAPGLHDEWKSAVLDELQFYCNNTQGSFVEEKSYSVAWHYRAVDKRFGEFSANEVMNTLKNIVDGYGLDVLKGDKVIEVKNNVVNKGKAALSCINKDSYDFVMAIGDDKSDEDMFKALPDGTITIKVGAGISAATYCQKSYFEVRELLKEMHESSIAASRNRVFQLAS
jgi:trehalose 6-phosphate synthase/phosphatase